jgi:site-specific recombinase XerD
MRRPQNIQIEDIYVILYELKDGIEIHFTSPHRTYIEAARVLLKYLEEEGFINEQPIKLITIPHSRYNGK